MLTRALPKDLRQIYDYQMGFTAPNFFPTDFESWKESFEQDVDGEGRLLFRELYGRAAYDGDTLVGFVQYGYTAFGFDEPSYPVIRSLYFDEGRQDAGRLLLQAALREFEGEKRVYTFFHYFGMSCFARHGKLFEEFSWISALLREYGFEVEHENVYYSAVLCADSDSEVELVAHDRTVGEQQTFDFMLHHKQIGGCEVHYLSAEHAYLRWVYVDEGMQNQGLGSECMAALKCWLRQGGMTRLDTDTALDNRRAQHYYEKNGFTRKGVTRSFFVSR